MKNGQFRHIIKTKVRYAYIKAALAVSAVSAFFLPNYTTYETTGSNVFTMYVNGTAVGMVENADEAEELLLTARRQIAAASDELVFMEVDTRLEGQEVIWGQVDAPETVTERIVAVLNDSRIERLQHSYMVRIGNYTISLADTGEVVSLLNSALAKYDSDRKFTVNLIADSDSEMHALTTQVVSLEELEQAQDEEKEVYQKAGVGAAMAEVMATIEPLVEKKLPEYDLGVVSMDFVDKVEIVEAYQPLEALTPIQEAIDAVTADQEVNTVYEVAAGDTLSEISLTTGIPLDKIIELNDSLENENSIIRAGEELIVTSTEPGISVTRSEQRYFEEDYEAEIEYIPNDDWYTNQTKVLQEPSAGHREAVALLTYRNDKEVSREVILEDVAMDAVAKVVERGTKIPPTYIKPLSGGRITSRFGPRKAPVKGASTYHKGVDFATPIGTTIVASCGGTVTKAGWGSGYGYVVYIQHADGRQTRYAHLSKVLVSAGQTVSQGQKIALSGNTGVSSGPHVHFEILINGKQVDPLSYLSY